MTTCRRTAGILAASMEGRPLRDRDARHVATCPRCASALAQLDGIEAGLRAAIRPLVPRPEGPAGLPTTAFSAGEVDARRVEERRTGLLPNLGLASVAALLTVGVLVGARLVNTPGASPAPNLLPVAMVPAAEGLHRSGLRCEAVAAGLECSKRLADGWRQVALLEGSAGSVGRIEIRLVAGRGAYPLDDVVAALSGPLEAVLGDVIDIEMPIRDSLADDGTACDCARPTDGGMLQLEGDPGSGYVLSLELPR
jgi:anti-sigma factor RsiW